MEPDDEALLERCAVGDRQASAMLINRHSPRVMSLAQRMMGSREDAEDITQDVFIKVFSHAGKWESGRARFTTWLHRVTLNQCYDRLRRKRETGVDDIPEMADESVGPAGQLQQQQTRDRIKTAIDGLPERQRAALLLNHYEGMSNIEAADVLEISVEAVESLLSRAKRALRAALIEERTALMGQME